MISSYELPLTINSARCTRPISGIVMTLPSMSGSSPPITSISSTSEHCSEPYAGSNCFFLPALLPDILVEEVRLLGEAFPLADGQSIEVQVDAQRAVAHPQTIDGRSGPNRLWAHRCSCPDATGNIRHEFVDPNHAENIQVLNDGSGAGLGRPRVVAFDPSASHPSADDFFELEIVRAGVVRSAGWRQ